MSDTVSCGACGGTVSKGDSFCPGCGTAVVGPVDTASGALTQELDTNPTQCVKCAAPMGRDDGFCPKCGTSRPEAATVISHVSLRNAQAAHLIEATKGEFEIIRQLGQGAMGAVYLARDVSLSRRVAIKVIAPNLLSDDTMISRFRLEAQTVASLGHPNIVNVHAVRQSDDLYYFVMEFIDGPPLRSIVKSNAPLDVSVVQGLLFQVGSALSYAHRTGRGVIHRDIKPANIMVDREGNAFVTDFGISKIAESQSGLTQTGATIGTPEYMSPEQCRGEQLTGSSDQYALGIVAYEMLCGQTPFSGSQYYVMVAHTSEQPKPIQETRPDCPPPVAQAVERMLAKTPQERWPDLDSAVAAMGGAPLGYKDPVRTKIIALTGTTLAQVPAVDASSPLSPAPGSASTSDTATSVTVTGLPSVIEVGDSFDLAADVRGSGSVSIPGLGVQWASTDPSIARVEAGHVEALRPGSVSISAVAGNVANTILLNITEPAPARMLVSPGSVRIQHGGRIGLSAQVLDRRDRVLERDVRWHSSDASVAHVTQSGEVVAAGGGSVTVTAESDGVTGTAEVVVEEAPVVAAPLVAAKAPVADKAGARPRAAAAAAAGPWFRQPKWIAASAAGVLGLSTIGLMALLGPDEPEPTRTAPNRVEVSLPVDTLAVGDSTRLVASAGGQPLAGPLVEWLSEDTDVAAVDSLGWVVALAEGQAVVSATFEGVTAVATLTVRSPTVQTAEVPEEVPQEDPVESPTPAVSTETPSSTVQDDPPVAETPQPRPTPPPTPTPATVQIELPRASMLVGEGQAAAARVLDSRGGRLSAGTYTLSWQSRDQAVISVDSRTGAVSASGPGSAWLVASAGNARDSIEITTTLPIVEVVIDGSDFSLELGSTRALSASVLGPGQQPIDRAVTWSSSDSGVATVDPGTGQVTTVSAGVAVVTASVDGFAAQVAVTVAEPAPSLPSAEAVQSAIETYLAVLGGGDRDALTRYWGSGDEDARDELLDLMGERDFSAALVSVEEPVLQGNVVIVSFQAAASYRSSFGNSRNQDLSFRAQLERSDSDWQLTTCVLQSGGEP